MVTKIAIVGMTESRRSAPWGQDDWTIWGLNDLHELLRPEQEAMVDLWFDLHAQAESELNARHTSWAKTRRTQPMMVMGDWVGYEAAVPFQAEELIAKFGTRYFTNSVSWMIAYAMAVLESELIDWKHNVDAGYNERPVPTIGLWGVDMTYDTEYSAQRPSCEHMLGIAQGMGYNVAISKNSDLLKAASVYGLESDSETRTHLHARRAELTVRLAEMRSQSEQIAEYIAKTEGKLEEIDYQLGVWTQPSVGSSRGTVEESKESSDG